MERAALVAVALDGKKGAGFDSSLEELARLVETAGGTVERTVIQRRPRLDPATLIGQGKALEVADLAKKGGWDLVVFDQELSPAQQRQLEEIIPAKVLDRTRIILDIFAQRARTMEGKLQVELAQLQYMLPRMTEKFGRFEQQKGGIGARGPGERKLEVDRRHVRERIVRIKKQIAGVRRQRSQQRENRGRVPLPIAALVGYTNAGKSTLLNTLHAPKPGSEIYADDKLFATLDPTTRRVKLPRGRPALFVDTVGFIQRLPLHLVAAFRATLEEVRDADLLVHVVDASNPLWPAQFKVVRDVLKTLKADDLPELVVYNKSDLLTARQRAVLRAEGKSMASAVSGEGLENFMMEIEDRLDRSLQEKEFFLPHNRRDLLSLVYKSGRMLGEKPAEGGSRVRIRIDPQNWGHIQKELKI